MGLGCCPELQTALSPAVAAPLRSAWGPAACLPARAPLAQLYVALSIQTAEPRLHAATTVAVPAKREALLFWTPV